MPTIGPKSAARLAFYIVGVSREEARRLAEAILEVKEKICRCRICFNLAEEETCPICQDPTRDARTVCVVADPRDIVAMERSREYRGLYHVLGGLISPMDGVGPEHLSITALLKRLQEQDVDEVILATDPNVNGETTALYLSRLLKPAGLKVSRLAYGLPHGVSLEFADEVTLGRSLLGRRNVE